MTLNDFLLKGMALPFAWGHRDCALWACDWIAERRGVDPAAAVRGAYGSELSCARLLKREGGLVALASRLFERAGLVQTDKPASGSVGIVETAHGPTMMIYLGEGQWAGKAPQGVTIGPAKVIQAWTV